MLKAHILLADRHECGSQVRRRPRTPHSAMWPSVPQLPSRLVAWSQYGVGPLVTRLVANTHPQAASLSGVVRCQRVMAFKNCSEIWQAGALATVSLVVINHFVWSGECVCVGGGCFGSASPCVGTTRPRGTSCFLHQRIGTDELVAVPSTSMLAVDDAMTNLLVAMPKDFISDLNNQSTSTQG